MAAQQGKGEPWVSVAAAAQHLGKSEAALQRMLGRHAFRANDGGVEALIPGGVRGRKLGNLWRVQLGPAWTGARAG